MKYEVAYFDESGNLHRGGIPTSKSHAKRWANENAVICPEVEFVVVEYSAETV